MPEAPAADITLHFAPRSRSISALWLLEELGASYRLESFDLASKRHKTAEFKAMNPMGKVPVVVDHGIPVSELGAIAIYLADRYPDAGLAPAIDDEQRPEFLRWIFFSSAIIEPALGEKFFAWKVPASSVAWGSYDDMLSVLVAGITDKQWLLGDRFTAADVLVGASTRFGQMFGAIPKTDPLGAYVDRLTRRPAFQRALAIETREGERFPPPA